MKEINFYIVDTDLESFFYNFLAKTIEKGKKSIVYSEDVSRLEKLDDYLWTCKKVEFLPHVLEDEKEAKDTPIVLTSKKQNVNNANFLFLENFLDDDFLDEFEKILYVIPHNNHELINKAKTTFDKYLKSGDKAKMFKRDEAGKWVEK